MNQAEREFIRGFACACGILGRGFGEPTAAQMILAEGGYTVDDLKAAKVEEIDINRILYGDESGKGEGA